MIEAVLVLVIVAMLAERAYANRRAEAERARILNAVIARNPADFAVLQRTVDEPPKPPRAREDDDGQYLQIGAS